MGTCRKLRFIQIKILAIWLKWGKWGKHLFAILTTLYLQIANKLWITNFIKMVSIKSDVSVCQLCVRPIFNSWWPMVLIVIILSLDSSPLFSFLFLNPDFAFCPICSENLLKKRCRDKNITGAGSYFGFAIPKNNILQLIDVWQNSFER